MGKFGVYLKENDFSYDGDLISDLKQKADFNRNVMRLFISISIWLSDEISEGQILLEKIKHENARLEETEAMKFIIKAGQYFANFTNDPTPEHDGVGRVWINGSRGITSTITLKRDGLFYAWCEKEKKQKELTEDLFLEILNLYI
ncbi:hypothetical protein [Flavobacterium sp. UBA7682]|uniref:hypothetical protein n=1 Tax=Flavobacterium sp. UBA7682 TaxID=1946560 RepID=UPI0025BCB301|nr:hypothetical protein [Flavobacterium sp. UBA7682]